MGRNDWALFEAVPMLELSVLAAWYQMVPPLQLSPLNQAIRFEVAFAVDDMMFLAQL